MMVLAYKQGLKSTQTNDPRSNNTVALFILFGGFPLSLTGDQCSNAILSLYSYMIISCYNFGILYMLLLYKSGIAYLPVYKPSE